MNKTEELQKKIKLIEKEIANLNANLEKLKKDLENEALNHFERVDEGKTYYTIALGSGVFYSSKEREENSRYDDVLFNNNNYFLTQERSDVVIDKIEYLLELERLYDKYCSDYVPDWDNSNELKYFIVFDNKKKRFFYDYRSAVSVFPTVYFPNREIASKVVDELMEHYGLKK